MSETNPKTVGALITALHAKAAEWKELSGLPTPLTYAALEKASQAQKTLWEAAHDLDTVLAERMPLSYEDEAREDNRRLRELDAREQAQGGEARG